MNAHHWLKKKICDYYQWVLHKHGQSILLTEGETERIRKFLESFGDVLSLWKEDQNQAVRLWDNLIKEHDTDWFRVAYYEALRLVALLEAEDFEGLQAFYNTYKDTGQCYGSMFALMLVRPAQDWEAWLKSVPTAQEE